MRRLRRHASPAAGLGLAIGLAACSGQAVPEAGVPAPLGAYGRVRVQVTRAGERADVLVSTRFVGFRGIDRATADLLTGGEPALAMGCGAMPPPAPHEDLVALLPEPAAGRVEHLDAGEITALVDGVAVAAGPTARPALSPYVGGMEYDDQAAATPVPRGEVLVTGAGGARVGAFEAGAQLPGPVDARATWGADLAVTWRAAGADPSDAGVRAGGVVDEVTVTIAPERGAAAVVCRGPDRGELHVRPELLARVAGVPSGAAVTVVIDRAHRAGFAAPGLADASLEVIARDVITATAP